MPQMIPSDLLTWGRLLKSWSTGLNYLDNIEAPPTANDTLPAALMWRPSMSIAEFNAIIANVAANHLAPGIAGFTMNPEAALTTVKFIQNDETTVYINLPAASEVTGGDNIILAGGTYHVPDFEMALYGLAPDTPPTNPPVTPQDRLNLTANFIGNYMLANCR